MRWILPIAALATCLSCSTQDTPATTDYTEENVFSENIEGPSFGPDGRLYVVNYLRDGTIGVISSDGVPELYVALPEGSIGNSIKFNSRGEMLVADFKGHNVLKIVRTDSTPQVGVLVHEDSFNQPNDLCINSHDQVFASDPNWKAGTGKIWRIDPTGSAVLLDSTMGTTNGITLSPDERILYVNESVQRKVWKFSVDENGNLSGKTLFTEFADFGMDGMKCDREGNLYITRYGKGTIAIYSPEGKFMREVQLKGKNCSNLVFGGNDGKTVYVTLQDRKCMETFVNEIPGAAF